MDAFAALGREEGDDVVARLDERHAVAHRLDDARTLVPEDAGGVAGRIGAGGRVEIGVADTAGGKPDDDLPGLRLGELHVLDDERFAKPFEHRSTNLHAAILCGALDAQPRSLSNRSLVNISPTLHA